MIAVDTNVLIRVLVDDPGQPRQVKVARARVKRAKQVFVSQVIQAEAVWVLESAYDSEKETIIGVLEHLLQNKSFILQNEPIFEKALAAYRTGRADFPDYLIHAESEAANCELITFDKRLARASHVGVLPS